MAKIYGNTTVTPLKVDSELSTTSTNPVQNKVVTQIIDALIEDSTNTLRTDDFSFVNKDDENKTIEIESLNSVEFELENPPVKLPFTAYFKDTKAREEIETLKDDKVDKEEGKGLSANDFTDAFKTMLENVDSEISPWSTNIPTSEAVFNLFANLQSQLPTPDSELSETSENSVQNKVVTTEINNINTLLDIYSMLYQQLTGNDEDGAVLRRYFHISEKEEPAEFPFYAETDYFEQYWMENSNAEGKVPYFVRFKDTKAREMIGDIETALDSILAMQTELIGGDA